MSFRFPESSLVCSLAFAGACAVVAGWVAFAQPEAEAAPAPIKPEAIDLAVFDATTDVAAGGEVNLMVQIHSAYQFPVNAGPDAQKTLVPLFAAAEDVTSTRVVAAVLVDDLLAFDAFLATNVIGNARMGDLYEINGAVSTAAGFDANIAATLDMAGLNMEPGFTVVAPFVDGRAVAIATAGSNVAPIWAWVFVALGLWTLAVTLFGQLKRDRSDAEALVDRFKDLQGFVIPAE